MEITLQEVLEKNKKLEQENKILKEKLKRKRSERKPIKTTKQEIIDYWETKQDECGLSVDWSEAHERCWRCGYKKPLERCHIIPDSLGGKDEAKNLVLLCKRCHIEAPNVEDKNFMWDWIRAYGTSFYDTFWKIKAQEEYKFIYKKSFIQELKDRDILSDSDFRRFWNTDIGKTSIHYGHPWYNTSTDAGVLKMRLDAYDKKYKNRKPKSEKYREKEKQFEKVVYFICNLAKEYKWNVWQGSSANLFSITISNYNYGKNNKYISIRLCNKNIYKASLVREANPNRIKASNYDIELGYDIEKVKEFVQEEVKKHNDTYGKCEKQNFVFTNNPIYQLKEQ